MKRSADENTSSPEKKAKYSDPPSSTTLSELELVKRDLVLIQDFIGTFPYTGLMDEKEIKDAMGVMRKHQPMAFHHVSKMTDDEKDIALVALGKKLCAARKDVLGLIK